MEIILHIGMGKTGTSSIQEALLLNRDNLLKQGVLYLGMWFDIIEPKFAKISGQADFFRSSPDEMKDLARVFVRNVAARLKETGAEKAIISNEEIYAQVGAISPFIAEIKEFTKVRLISYVRDPREWLPSAYNQWSVYHKTYMGPIRSYKEMSRELIGTYHGFQLWGAHFSDLITVRKFDRKINIVDDFSAVAGINLPITALRTQERTEPAEGLLRLVFSNQDSAQYLPSDFDAAIFGLALKQVPSIAHLADMSLNYEQTDDILSKRGNLFEYIKEKFGVDVLEGVAPPQTPIDLPALRNRLLEYALSMLHAQSLRIRSLEAAIEELQRELRH